MKRDCASKKITIKGKGDGQKAIILLLAGTMCLFKVFAQKARHQSS